jgi:hypothetical protein
VSAGGAIQTAIAAALNAIEGLAGVFDGPPARAAFPYVSVDAATEVDWSHQTAVGREVMIGLTVWDDQPVRLHGLADTVESAVRAIATVDDWQLVTMRLVRRRVMRDVAGPWAAAIDFRARMLAQG